MMFFVIRNKIRKGYGIQTVQIYSAVIKSALDQNTRTLPPLLSSQEIQAYHFDMNFSVLILSMTMILVTLSWEYCCEVQMTKN